MQLLSHLEGFCSSLELNGGYMLDTARPFFIGLKCQKPLIYNSKIENTH